jgi:riboflavin synthase
MFTGIVETTGPAELHSAGSAGGTLWVGLGSAAEGVRIGDSIAVSGCCLTVVELQGERARFDLAPETLSRTWFGQLLGPTRVNLERALRLGDRLGGHIVQGHVDGMARVVRPVDPSRPEDLMQFRLAAEHMKYCVPKGSISLDGVSLTIASVAGDVVGIAVIPHTAAVTTLGTRRAGDPVHVELDVIAKHVERLLGPYTGQR